MKGRGVHPSKDITGSEGSELQNTRIVLCITGSVAAYKAIDLARMLMRHGAEVHAVMTESTASTLLNPEMMKWATGNPVVTKLTGDLEHVMLADYGMSDLVIVYPCTANTIGKMAAGIDDTPVTSVLSVALGSKIPIVIAPAMHEAMYENQVIQENMQRLRDLGVIFLAPTISDGKAKVAEPDQLVDLAKSILSGGALSGRTVLITTGSTIEYIDPIRVIGNTSSGKMGVALAQQATRMGAIVTLICGYGSAEPDGDSVAKVSRVSTSQEMREAVISELTSKKYDIVIMAAAVTDFMPNAKSERKIDTRHGRVELSLVPTKKIVDEVKKLSPRTVLVAFKADYNVSESVLVQKSLAKLRESDADLVVANDLGRRGSGAGSDDNEVLVVDRKKRVVHLPLQSKEAIARKLLERVASICASIKGQGFT